MSSFEASRPHKWVTLNIQAADAFTEIRVLDARFEPVALTSAMGRKSNTGSITVDVVPGLYEVGFECVEGWENHHVIARSEDTEVAVRQTSPPRSRAATAEVLTASGPQPRNDVTLVVSLAGIAHDPAVAATTNITAALIGVDSEAQIADDLVPDHKHSWQFAVAPGYWRLQLSEPDGRQFELPLTVCPNYRLEVEAPLSQRGGFCIDLERLRVRLRPIDQPDTIDPALIRYEEAALAALSGGRALYGRDFEQLIDDLADQKRLNPMLGMLAAHLCDRGEDDDLGFQGRLLERLTELTGGAAVGHPDIAALRQRFRMRTGQSIEEEPPVAFPPLLAASWAALLNAARVRPELIPAHSLSERIAARLWSSSLWIAWSLEPVATAQADAGPRSVASPTVKTAEEFGTLTRMIADMLAHQELREWFRHANNPPPGGLENVNQPSVTPAEAAVASVLYPVADDEEQQDRLARIAAGKNAQGSETQSSGADLTSLSRTLGLPPTTVEGAVGSLAGKLESQASEYKIKF
ncbi:hypothetical protein GOL26_09635 [Sinorhizobium medicae]|uniref:hypothetical protein n=1 Tax=Rhizobium meliloti TaxID=382 RepID=UPI000FD389A3|nr:hypothetical protein [Sinorhizobium meliloti]MDX0995193.1 hypothetical protein [Sinorhizobium medicae]MDX1179053.1 hypothetical protein [Sinorhizobium medicae]RVH09646.1 hypothetical protein CN216_27890 [Sinorhizobium meliloti]RVI15014.1 hypothetical protein CN206_03620 [Sinorhizobium meliloti]